MVKVNLSECHYYLKMLGKTLVPIFSKFYRAEGLPNTPTQIASYDGCDEANMHKIGEFVPIFDIIKHFHYNQ